MAFEEESTQQDVYNGTAKEFVPSLLDGFNVTVFAYGATGSGKVSCCSIFFDLSLL